MPPETNGQNQKPLTSPLKPITPIEPVTPTERPTPSIHTLEGDIFSAVKDENYSNNIVKIAAKARKVDASDSSGHQTNGNTSYTKILVVVGIMLVLIVGGVIAFYVLKPNTVIPTDNNPGNTSSTTPNTSQPIVGQRNILETEAIVQIDIKTLNKFQGVDKIQQVQKELRSKKINKNTAVQVSLGLSAVEFFQKNQYSGGEGLVGALGTDYIFGLFNTSADVFESFVVFKVNNYDEAFAEMLSWEGYVVIDFKDMFKDSTYVSPTATSTETVVDTTPKSPTQTGFRDRVIRNTDARVYINAAGEIELVYGFINKDYLVISGGVDSFIDIKTRLLNRNILR